MSRSLALATLCLGLAACGSETKAPVAKDAGGEVLEGSISDAMLPLDTVRSQAPLAPRPAGDAGDKPAQESDPAPDETASAEPAAEAQAAEVRPDAE